MGGVSLVDWGMRGLEWVGRDGEDRGGEGEESVGGRVRYECDDDLLTD